MTMDKKMKDLNERASEVHRSKEGEDALRMAYERALKSIEKFKKSRDVNPDLLTRPFTI